MPALWMPGATRMDVGNHAPTDGGPAKAIAHITWDKNATASAPADLVPYETLQAYFGTNPAGKEAAPHLLWDPFTGRVTQFLPADSRSKSLADKAGGTRTNRAGSVVLQVETLFFPYCRVNGKVYAKLSDTPCKGWQEVLAWISTWGVPKTWPMGHPVNFNSNRSETVWRSTAGWYAHAHVPENDHQDPGSWPAFTTPPATPEPEEPPVTTPAQLWSYKGTDDPRDAFDYQREVPVDVWTYRKGQGTTNPDPHDAWWYLADTNALAFQTRANTVTLAAKVDVLTAKVDSLETTGLTEAQILAIAEATADILSARLAN